MKSFRIGNTCYSLARLCALDNEVQALANQLQFTFLTLDGEEVVVKGPDIAEEKKADALRAQHTDLCEMFFLEPTVLRLGKKALIRAPVLRSWTIDPDHKQSEDGFRHISFRFIGVAVPFRVAYVSYDLEKMKGDLETFNAALGYL